MYVLKKIEDIEWKRLCFCGKPLIKGFCELHGSDIKASSLLIHAQFENIQSKNNNLISLSLTQNQFLNLFPKKELDNFYVNHEEYEIKISQFGTLNDIKLVIGYFFNQIESDKFFKLNRVRDVQITDSGITIHFLYDFKILSHDKLTLKFNTLALRSLDDYIEWRLFRFKAKPENIIKSLIDLRKNVYDEKGELYQIFKINWNQSENLPKSIEVQNNTERKVFKSSKLFHGQDNLLLFTKLESRINKSLRSFSQQFTNSLKKYLIAQSCLAKINKISQTNLITFNRFIGKEIKNSINLNDLTNKTDYK